jgi:hypothetical protein
MGILYRINVIVLENEWWTKPNPEGISNKDVLQVFGSNTLDGITETPKC